MTNAESPQPLKRKMPKAPRPLTLEANIRLVYSVAKRFRWACGGSLSMEDLVQAGSIGLMRAIERFDPERGFAFSTYATHWVRQHMRRSIQNERRVVRVPVHALESALRRGDPFPLDAHSLDQPIRANGEKSETWLSTLSTEDDPTLALEADATRQIVERALADLPSRTRLIMRQRFWSDRTLEEIGQQLGLTRERVRQIEAGALQTLRSKLRDAQ